MKNYNIRAILMALILAACIVTASAHPGRTDANGGHWNRETGEYHYHHGYPPHQHPGGECPYNMRQRPTEPTAAIPTQKPTEPESKEKSGSSDTAYHLSLAVVIVLGLGGNIVRFINRK